MRAPVPLVTQFLPLVLLLALAVPTYGEQYFNGLPFSRPLEFVAALLLAPTLFSARLRRAGRRMAARLSPARQRMLAAIPAAALLLKAGLFWAGTSYGFAACYRSGVPEHPSTQCERSYENPLFHEAVTRLDPVVDFGSADWSLSFINSIRFNYSDWTHGTYRRARLPFQASWRGTVVAPPDRVLQIRYAGEGSIQIGGRRFPLRPVYGRVRRVEFPLEPGRQRLVIRYRFDDGTRTMEELKEPGPTLRVLDAPADERAGSRRVLEPAGVGAPQRLVERTADLSIGVFVVLVLVSYVALVRREAAILATGVTGGVVAAYLRLGVDPGWLLFAGMTALCWWFLYTRGHRPRRLLIAYLCAAALVISWTAATGQRLDEVLVRDGGQDPLAYESFARSILETGSLEAGERVFYFQPLSRYVTFVKHLLFGDGDALPTAALVLALNFALIWFVAALPAEPRRCVATAAAAAAILLTVGLTTSEEATLAWIRTSGSEALTWVLLPVAFGAIYGCGRKAARSAGIAALALSLTTRFNQAPAVLWLSGVLMWRNRRAPWRWLAWWLVLWLALASLPLIHNLYYGGQAVIATTSGGIPENLLVNPREIFDGPAFREKAARQLSGILYYGTAASIGALHWLFRSLQILWIGAVLSLWGQRRERLPALAAVLIIPVLYLGVHMFYQVLSYYPRHIVAGHMAMGLATVTAVRLANPRKLPRRGPSDRSR